MNHHVLKLASFHRVGKRVSYLMDRLECKSADTYRHSVRVSALAGQFADYLGLGPDDRTRLVQGCYLHDLGKLLIPDSILKREGGLSAEQWEMMKEHPVCGGDMLSLLFKRIHPSVLGVVTHHHERWDGSGYPDGLCGEQIPYYARICSILDAFDSMTSDRCYRRRLTYEQSVAELRRNSRRQFDPVLVERFVAFASIQASIG